NTKHGYPKPQREAVTRWMSRWLLHKDVPIVEPVFTIAKDADLQCTRSGQVLEDFKGKSAFHIIAEYEAKYAKERSPNLKDIGRLVALPDKAPAAKRVQRPSKIMQAGKLSYVTSVFETEP